VSGAADVVVIGGGIVGACCAYELARDGASVTVLERDGGWGQGCSWGNAGLLPPSHARPIAAPENLRAGLRWMLRRDSPALAPWIARYVRASTKSRAASGEALQRDLCVEGLARFDQFGIDGGFRRSGCLTVYTGRRAEERAAAEAGSPAGRALEAQTLTATEARELEPALTDAVRGAVLFPHEGQCDPVRLVGAVGAAAEEQGVRLRSVEARVVRDAAVETDEGDLRAGLVVVAAGAWSGRLARTLGVRLPLLAGKGYAVDYPATASPAGVPLYLHDERCVANPMGSRLRVTGGLILGALEQRNEPRRVRAIERAAAGVLGVRAAPRLKWSGLRPCTPDGLPVIGRHQRAENVLFATGHGMLGVTLGPLTGRLVADLAAGRPPHPALERLSPQRFET
jgi:D-amino-acid dehydrogenase